MSEEDASLDGLISTVTKRAEFLSVLSSGAMPKRDLQDELDVSRSTVYKAIRELRERDLVERTDDGLALTLVGRILEAEYDSFRGCVKAVSRTRQLLSILPSNCDIPTPLLKDADIVLAERHAPNHPIQYFETMVSEVDRVRGLSPVALHRYVELFHERAVSDGMPAELVLEQPVVEYLVADYSDQLREALNSGGLSLWETETTLPFGLIVGEGNRDRVGVVVYDARGELRGLIANHTPEAVAWGHETFETYRDGGTLVSGE